MNAMERFFAYFDYPAQNVKITARVATIAILALQP